METSPNDDEYGERLMSKKNVDELERLLLGDDELLELPLPKKSSRTSISDMILFYLFVERVKEKERKELVEALKSSIHEEREMKKKIINLVDKIASKIDKATDILLEAYIPFRFKTTGGGKGTKKVEVEIDA